MTPGRPSDPEITRWALAAGQGDHGAQDRFVRATQRDVWRFIAHLTDPTSADDLAQETYLRALRSLPTFSARSCARTWLLTIARRVVIDHIRTSTTRPRQAVVHDWQHTAERTQPRGLPGFDEGIALAQMLDTLDPDRREAFVLTQLLGQPYATAAEVCGCPVGTIRSRVARARDDLITQLRAAESTSDGRSAG